MHHHVYDFETFAPPQIVLFSAPGEDDAVLQGLLLNQQNHINR